MIRIVVVDDEPDTRDIMIASIDAAMTGISVIGAASDGIEAYNMICSQLPDVVLIDIEMPGMSGLDVIRKVREQNLATVFIIVSSYGEFSYAQEAISLNVQDYLLKPFMPIDVYNAVYRAAEHIRSLEQYPYFKHIVVSAEKENDKQKGLKTPLRRQPLNYPYKQERTLINSILLGCEEEIRSALAEFFALVRLHNTTPAAINNCYIILYVEIHHILMSRSTKIEDFNMSISTLTTFSEQLFEHTLAEFCLQLSHMFSHLKTSSSVVPRAVNYIKEHYNEPLSLEKVSGEVYASPNYLSSLFKVALNISFTDYIQMIRTEKAKEILAANPHFKDYEIAEMVGFSSAKYFSIVFKKITGITVSQYRTQLY